MANAVPDDEAARAALVWASAELGAPSADRLVARRCGGGTTAAVFVLHDPRDHSRAIAVLKCVRADRGFARECEALRAADGLVEADHCGAPRLLAAAPALRALLMTHVAGADAVDAIARHPSDAIAIWAGAGALRRRLDAVPCGDDDPVAIGDALSRRFRVWLGRARAHLPAPLCDAIAARIDTSPFEGHRRVACHRDFDPRNWRVQGHGADLQVACVDFGHARGDHPLTDLVRACVPLQPDAPRVLAFLRGWGRELDARAWACARQLALLQGLCTATWGRAHQAPEFIAAGDAALQHVLAAR
ncbi:MAG: hypothetical protein IPH07_10450 [Deltaproteobacteria bacterium]|nr:hypothetical protein [Deltaproteobacteria bacterium]MBK8718850.1 hypothetical protein [Deltaproteobacteria bacterium]